MVVGISLPIHRFNHLSKEYVLVKMTYVTLRRKHGILVLLGSNLNFGIALHDIMYDTIYLLI